MGGLSTTSDVLDQALRAADLEEAFDDRGVAYEDCPGCGAHKGLKLSLARGQVQCSACGSAGPLIAYLREKAAAGEWNHEPYSEAEIIPIEPRLRETDAANPPDAVEVRPVRQTSPALVAELVSEAPIVESAPPKPRGSGRMGERIIMSLLAVIFLGAGLAAAGLSGFANFQAFSLGVSDPTQARIWGWSGVIASVCSFGGFTFFWWHLSGGRRGEAVRAFVFALAGAGTSIAGTTLFMLNNAQGQADTWQSAAQIRALTEAEIADWTRQLEGIPPETRSIDGLKAYLAGVEAAGRTHQKPYRDAQNELGLAERRAQLEAQIAAARADLRTAAVTDTQVRPARNLPAWFFALMLELFSSQATSIAFVSLLLLYGRKPEAPRDEDLGPVV
ncbi:MAG: hypothetical protein HRT81_07720 [Henriciella sp.]|nr:hypothetical protein [Henriciella sp.]